MKTIELTQGKVAIVDDWNYEWLNQFNWYAYQDPKNGRWYAGRHGQMPNGKGTTQSMHRFIMGVTDPKIQVDHKDRNATLDNREENLRVATTAQNQWNAGLRKDNTSGFKGVRRDHKQWRTEIKVFGKTHRLGYFDTAIEAAQAYNEAAKKLHGEFAYQNDLSQ